jgi:WhiB family redox-sensing transcriptional regulator
VHSSDPVQPSGSPRRKAARPHRNLAASGPEPWMWDAACATADPEVFFPREGDEAAISAAKRVCARCPVRDQCLQYSFDTREEFGIWGGLDEWERHALLESQQREHDGDAEGVA